jgi:membrane-bound inhibitor of C-type lysozyme
MRFRSTLACALVLAACRPTTAPQSQPQPRPQPSSPAAPAGPVNADPHVTDYRCDDGQTVRAGYPDAQTAVVSVGGHAYTLKAGRAASGVRYVGFGLQWWTKGMAEGRLSRLKPDEEVASDPGVMCRTTPAAAQPPAPGAPGGLPDDRTPLVEGPIKPESAQGAAQVVQSYYALLESGRFAEAWRLWSDGGRASGRSEEDFAHGFRAYSAYHAQIGGPGAIEGAAGSLYVEVPVVLYGSRANGTAFTEKAKVTLRRVNDVPGSTPEQRRWHIAHIEAG